MSVLDNLLVNCSYHDYDFVKNDKIKIMLFFMNISPLGDKYTDVDAVFSMLFICEYFINNGYKNMTIPIFLLSDKLFENPNIKSFIDHIKSVYSYLLVIPYSELKIVLDYRYKISKIFIMTPITNMCDIIIYIIAESNRIKNNHLEIYVYNDYVYEKSLRNNCLFLAKGHCGYLTFVGMMPLIIINNVGKLHELNIKMTDNYLNSDNILIEWFRTNTRQIIFHKLQKTISSSQCISQNIKDRLTPKIYSNIVKYLPINISPCFYDFITISIIISISDETHNKSPEEIMLLFEKHILSESFIIPIVCRFNNTIDNYIKKSIGALEFSIKNKDYDERERQFDNEWIIKNGDFYKI